MSIPRTQTAGFTLLEMLVAVFIFAMALTALMTIAGQGIRSVDQATDRATAQFLAQEGIELVEQARDDNFLDVSNPWLEGLLDVCGGGQVCAQDVAGAMAGNQFFDCGGQCPALGQESSNGRYGYTGGASPFTRSIAIDDTMESMGVVRVVSTVAWQRGNATFSVEAVKYMTNWFQ